MAQHHRQSKPGNNASVNVKPADVYYNLYNPVVRQSGRVMHLIAIPVILFSLLGLLWVIPFPHIGFLGRYNGFFNWASFLIAFVIYYYLRIAPYVSYTLLLFLLLCAYGVTELLTYQATNGLQVWLVCLIMFVAALAACIATAQFSNQPGVSKTKLILAAPVWAVRSITKAIGR